MRVQATLYVIFSFDADNNDEIKGVLERIVESEQTGWDANCHDLRNPGKVEIEFLDEVTFAEKPE